jgi:putative sterol carrier protein
MMGSITIRQIMQELPGAFSPENAGNIQAVIQVHVTGEEAGDWVIIIRDLKCSVSEGVVEKANLTFKADSQDLLAMLDGRLNPISAYMQGRIGFSGDMALAMRLPELFAAGFQKLKEQRSKNQ